MGNFLLGLLISIVVGIIIIVGVFMLTKKKTVGDKSQKQKPSATSDTSVKTTKSNSSGKVIEIKSNSFAAIIGRIIGLALAAVVLMWSLSFVLKVWKNTFSSKPKYETVMVWVKTDSIRVNLERSYKEANTICLREGQKADAKNATVALCVKNIIGEEACGDAYTDPNLPKSSANQKMWLKSRDGQLGTVDVIIYDKVLKKVQVK